MCSKIPLEHGCKCGELYEASDTILVYPVPARHLSVLSRGRTGLMSISRPNKAGELRETLAELAVVSGASLLLVGLSRESFFFPGQFQGGSGMQVCKWVTGYWIPSLATRSVGGRRHDTPALSG